MDKKTLRNGSPQVFLNTDSKLFPNSFPGFGQIFSNKMAMSLNGSALVRHTAHNILFSFSDIYKSYLLQRRHTLMAFLAGEWAAE